MIRRVIIWFFFFCILKISSLLWFMPFFKVLSKDGWWWWRGDILSAPNHEHIPVGLSFCETVKRHPPGNDMFCSTLFVCSGVTCTKNPSSFLSSRTHQLLRFTSYPCFSVPKISPFLSPWKLMLKVECVQSYYWQMFSFVLGMRMSKVKVKVKSKFIYVARLEIQKLTKVLKKQQNKNAYQWYRKSKQNVELRCQSSTRNKGHW